MHSQVLIVGAGPNGLLLATELATAGVRPLVLEKLAEPDPTPKANGLVGRVVEALDRRGLYALFTGSGTPPAPVPYFQFGALPLDMSALDDNALYAVPVPQRRMEELLAERAAGLGVTIHRGHAVTGLRQDAHGVTVDVRGPDGTYQVTAEYVVGADGGRSTVRGLAGIGFPGHTDHTFVSRSGEIVIGPPVAGPDGLELPGVGRRGPTGFVRTEHGVLAYGMFRPGVWRVGVFEWDGPPADDDAPVSFAELRAAVHRVIGADVPVSEPPGGGTVGRSTTGINSRLAERYRDGRVLLLGDAAHVQSGIGGPGLNLGLQDALNLGWKLAAVVTGTASADLLDSYHDERQPVAARVITQSRAQLALLAPGPNVTALRQILAELLTDPPAVRRISDLLSGADTRYDVGDVDHPLAGRWMPELTLHRGSGPVRLAELARSGRPLLLDLAGRADLVTAAADWVGRVDVVIATCPDRPADVVVIRPDGFVAWATGPGPDGVAPGSAGAHVDRDPTTGAGTGDARGLRAALARWCGPGAGPSGQIASPPRERPKKENVNRNAGMTAM